MTRAGFVLLLGSALMLQMQTSCKAPVQRASGGTPGTVISGSSSRAAAPGGLPVSVDGKLWSSVLQQRAGEYKALCLQAFNIGRFRVDQALDSGNPLQHPAVITDVDETFLDNSPYAITQSLNGQDYTQSTWEAWTARAEADTVPGALAFFNHCRDRGVDVYYITNRTSAERSGTLSNLQRFGFPFADEQHLVTRGDESSKENRRKSVMKDHEVILLLGDNLADFSAMFDKQPENIRNQRVLSQAEEFGRRFIILPNFTYGGWEEAINQYQRDLSARQKDSLLLQGARQYIH